MKNLAKSGLLILGIAIAVTACDPTKGSATKSPVDSGEVKIDTANKKIDSAKKAGVDTVRKDTTKKP